MRLIEHPASHFAVPPGRGEKFTLVEVTMFSGRSMAAKRALDQAIVRNLTALGVPALDIKITLIEARLSAPQSSLPGLTRQSVNFEMPFGCWKSMDSQVKPAYVSVIQFHSLSCDNRIATG